MSRRHSHSLRIPRLIHSQQISLMHNRASQKQQNSFLSEDQVYRELVTEIGIRSSNQKKHLKQNVKDHYKKHLSLIQAHQFRLIRFKKSHQKSLHELRTKVTLANETLIQNQIKADLNKRHRLQDRNKKVEDSLTRWKQKVDFNNKKQKQRIRSSTKIIGEWEDKLISSASRKSLKLQEISQSMREHLDRVESRQSQRERLLSLQSKQNKNPERSLLVSAKSRGIVSPSQSQRKLASNSSSRARLSTQVMVQKHQKIVQAELEKSLFMTVESQKRIQHARDLKRLLEEAKIKKIKQKQQYLKELQKKHTEQQQKQTETRNKKLDRKYFENRKKIRLASLPVIQGFKKIQSQHFPDEQYEYKRDYSREIVSKLRNMSIVMGKYVSR